MAHLTPEQFVDLAEGVTPESAVPHLASCEACRRELVGLRAMMSKAVEADAGDVPEPSPLFWNHLSSHVRSAVAEEPARGRWLTWPRILMPSLAGAIAIMLAVIFLPREVAAPGPLPLPSSTLAVNVKGTLPTIEPLAPLGTADDPQLRIVAAVADAVDWDEMMDEVAMSSAGSSDAVASALTVDERRELQRLLAEEVAQPNPLEKRS